MGISPDHVDTRACIWRPAHAMFRMPWTIHAAPTGSYEKGTGVGNSGFLPRGLHRTPDRHRRLPRGWCRGQRGMRVIGTLRHV